MALGLFAQKTALEEAGLKDRNEMNSFREALEANPAAYALSQEISRDAAIGDETQKKFLTEVGKKWRSDPQVFEKLNAELQSNRNLGDQIKEGLKSNPDKILGAVSPYNGSNMGAMLPPSAAMVTAAPVVRPQVATPAPGPTTSGAQTVPQPATAPSVTTQRPSSPAPSPANSDEDLNGIISASDQEIRGAIDVSSVRLLADKMAKVATENYGVNAATANGFKERIGKDPKLAQSIATNLQNNPDFVRSLAKMAKDKSTAPEPIKSKAQQELNSLMSNPEKLADDKYVKGLQSQLQLAENFKKSGLTDMMQKFVGMMGPLKSGFNEVGLMFSGLMGEHNVLSMSRGNSLIPDLLINLDAYKRNKEDAIAFGRYSPLDMLALAPKGADGKFFHNGEPLKDREGKQIMKDGKPAFEQVPNGQIALKTADGKEMKAIPAIGLVAKQMPGQYDQNGKFVPGNIRVPIVTEISEHGASSKITTVTLTPAEFAKYKQLTDAAAVKNGGSTKELAFEAYTETDARESKKRPSVQVATVNPSTGATSPLATVQAASPSDPRITDFALAPNGSVVDKRGSSPGNDQDYRLQG